MLNTINEMIEEIKLELTKGIELEEIRDNSGEWVDNYVPVYNNRIIEEWQAMPGDYDDRGALELGLGQEVSIINLMTLDLYLYYSDLFSQALSDVESELEESVSA
jgi:hypothetical protein